MLGKVELKSAFLTGQRISVVVTLSKEQVLLITEMLVY